MIEATLAGGVVVDGEDGSDAVSVNLGSLDGAVAVDDSGSEGVDTLTVHGTPEADSLTVSDAQVARIDETISFGAGIEGLMVHGGAGDDDISVAVVDPAFSATLTVEGEDGNDSIDASATTATITIGGGGGRDVLTGGTGANTLDGGDGDDVLQDGGGTNTIIGGTGSNTFIDAGGSNTFEASPGSTTPEVYADAYSVAEDVTLAVPANLGVFINDLDPNGTVLTAALVSGPMHGGLVFQQDGTFTYTPDTDFSGRDTFTYRAKNEANETSSEALVQVDVMAVADAPNLSVSDATGSEGVAIPLDVSAALNDTDASESLSIQIAGVPVSAVLSAGTDLRGGSWILSPDDLPNLAILVSDNAQFSLSVTATATESSNDDAESTSGSMNLTVNNVVPTLADATFTIPENSLSGTRVGTVTGTDPGDDTLTYSIVGQTPFAIGSASGQITVAE